MTYLEVAVAASNCEKMKRYLKAAEMWADAANLARASRDNDHYRWAKAREDWCLRGRGEWKFGGEV